MKYFLSHITILFCVVFGLFLSGECYGYNFIDSTRKIQLDSITTNIDKSIRRDLDKVHQFLYCAGNNREERVWMYYGYIATHCKYDKKRKKQKNKAPYNPEYTAKKLSGVCIDFANLFKAFCDKSDIPCMVVNGKCPLPFIEVVRKWIKRESNQVNHAWNIVKIRGRWYLMDPTWSRVISVKKYYAYDEHNNRYTAGKAKIVDRTYYSRPAVYMQRDHKPIHPAFFASENVPTWKTALKKEKRKKVYQEDYNYASVLDSIYLWKETILSSYYFEKVEKYLPKKHRAAYWSLMWELDYCREKTIRSNRHCFDDYEKSLERIEQIGSYLEGKYKFSYSKDKRLQAYYDEVAVEIAKIRKQEEKALALE